MRKSSESPKPGSTRKRQRLSSPTYEEHFPITQEEMRAFDEIDKQLSQSISVIPSQSRALPMEEPSDQEAAAVDTDVLGEHKEDRDGATVQAEWSSSPLGNPSTTQDHAADDNFFSTGVSVGQGGFVSAASIPANPPTTSSTLFGFTSGAAAPLHAPLSRIRPSIGGFTSAAKLSDVPSPQHREQDDTPVSTTASFIGFGPASALPARPDDPYEDDSPQSPPPERDYSSWFDTDASVLPPDAFAFKTASAIIKSPDPEGDSTNQASQLVGFTSGLAQWKVASQADSKAMPGAVEAESTTSAGFGFSSAAQLTGRKSNWIAPSAAALARAAQMMKQWEEEEARQDVTSSGRDVENVEPDSSSSAPRPPTSTSFQTPLRPVLKPMENSEPSPAQLPDTPLASKNPTRYTTIGGMQIKNKQFKSPLISKPNRASTTPATRPGSSLNPSRMSELGVASGSNTKLPALFTFGATAAVPGAVPATPARAGPSSLVTSPGKGKSLGMTPRRADGPRSVVKAKFSTPFKSGMTPGEPGRAQLGVRQSMKANAQTQTPIRISVSRTPSSAKGKARKDYKFFDLNPPPERKTLASSGLRPESHSEEQLADMGINVEELRQMKPTNAIYYLFHSTDPTEGTSQLPRLGPEAAYARLRELGCTLATQEWVTNHYGLILWKLAGMVCLEPEREWDPRTKRWCWPEVIRQLLYRYERELNGGSRPALRLICTEDAPAVCPMVLCVSNTVLWAPAVVNEDGKPVEPHPELEVTDGWYRMRVRIDKPLARAVRRGLIRVGTKLAVSGAKLSGDRKEACEILEAYDNTYLDLSGNSTHLAPWHAKLGFVKVPFVATLDSLTPDGAAIPALDLIITKAYPIAYLEFVRNEDGSTTKFGPRNEKEELKLHDAWLAKRDVEAAKIRADLEKHIQLMEQTSEQLYSLAGPRFDDKFKQYEPLPGHIEDLWTEMMEEWVRPSFGFNSLTYMDAGWLHIHTLDQIRLAKERLSDDIERELQHVCPPRGVRDFRVVVAKDARWRKKESTRTVQITLWDPMRMVFSEGGTPGDIREGQRFLVTNLQPNQMNAWMDPGPESVIYLVSKKGASWTSIKSGKC